jgi:hypothetical protein
MAASMLRSARGEIKQWEFVRQGLCPNPKKQKKQMFVQSSLVDVVRWYRRRFVCRSRKAGCGLLWLWSHARLCSQLALVRGPWSQLATLSRCLGVQSYGLPVVVAWTGCMLCITPFSRQMWRRSGAGAVAAERPTLQRCTAIPLACLVDSHDPLLRLDCQAQRHQRRF